MKHIEATVVCVVASQQEDPYVCKGFPWVLTQATNMHL